MEISSDFVSDRKESTNTESLVEVWLIDGLVVASIIIDDENITYTEPARLTTTPVPKSTTYTDVQGKSLVVAHTEQIDIVT